YWPVGGVVAVTRYAVPAGSAVPKTNVPLVLVVTVDVAAVLVRVSVTGCPLKPRTVPPTERFAAVAVQFTVTLLTLALMVPLPLLTVQLWVALGTAVTA